MDLLIKFEIDSSHHFTGVDYDNKSKKNAIFKIQGDGKTWSKNVDKEKGSKLVLRCLIREPINLQIDEDWRRPTVEVDFDYLMLVVKKNPLKQQVT